MLFAALFVVLVAVNVLSVGFAASLGARAERWGALVYGLSIGLAWGAQAVGDRTPVYAFMLIDLATCLAFGVIMLRHPDKLWPGLAAVAQLLVFVFSATRVIDFPLSETAYLVMLNVSGLAVASAIAAGTWATRWGRRAPSEWDIAAERYEAQSAASPR